MAGDSKNFRLRETIKLILPREHGSWSLALEPLALGLLVAPTAAGGALAAAALGGFFLRRPLKLVLRAKSDPRRPLALGCVVLLGIFALGGLSLAAKFGGWAKLWPLIPSAMAGTAFAWFDSRNEAREGAAGLTGAIAFGILPAAFGALAGWNAIESIALALVMLTRSIPTVLFVRTYLRRNKGREATSIPAIVAAVAGFLLAVWLVTAGIAPWLAMVFTFVLAARALWLLGGTRRFAAKTVGMAEMVLGATMVLSVAATWKCL